MADFYKEDLAYIHDSGFSYLAINAALLLLNILEKEGKDRGLIVDLGCGSGILAQDLSAAGYDVLGIDLSEDLIAIARQRVPQGQFQVESFLTAKIPSCMAVTAIGECFNYLFDCRNTREELWNLFQRVYESLDAGGVLLFDVAVPGRVPGSGAFRNYTEGEDWAVLVTVEEDKQHQRLTRQITTFRKVGEFYRRDREVHQLVLYECFELVEKLQEIGFDVQTLKNYETLQFPAGHIGFLARKPAH
jgi:SAM-dependent methyltransferase